MSQHASLGADRWRDFTRDRQILMIGNEMNRARRFQGAEDIASRRLAYERVLRLTDLTVDVSESKGLRRELLRWRDLVAALYIAAAPDPAVHDSVLRVLLRMTPGSAKQIPLLLA